MERLLDHHGLTLLLPQRPGEAGPWQLALALFPLVGIVLAIVCVPGALRSLGTGEELRWVATAGTLSIVAVLWTWPQVVTPHVKVALRITPDEIQVVGWLGRLPWPRRAVLPSQGLFATFVRLGDERCRIELTGQDGRGVWIDAVILDEVDGATLYRALLEARAGARGRFAPAETSPELDVLRRTVDHHAGGARVMPQDERPCTSRRPRRTARRS